MRADRLVAILMMLQTKGQVTAAEVADELEISERTARRDLDALGQAGLPIYSTQGRGGGWRLLGSGRTDLSGLTAPEARALFRLAGPSTGATPELRAALRKLVRALPEPFRPGAEAVATSMVVESGWGYDTAGGRRTPPPLLDDLQRAVVEGRQVRLGYVDRQGVPSVRVVEPLGLVAKGSTWYLMAGTEAGSRTFRIDRVDHVEQTGLPATKPDDFDLVEAWSSIKDRVEELRLPVLARCSVDPDRVRLLRYLFGTRVVIGGTRPDGRVAVDVRGRDAYSLAVELGGLAAAVEVHEPDDLRQELGRIGRQLVQRYGAA